MTKFTQNHNFGDFIGFFHHRNSLNVQTFSAEEI